MPLPTYPRVVYAKSPLVEAVGQFCFPANLQIDVEPPAKFHQRIRDAFPFYEWKERGETTSHAPAPARSIQVKPATPKPAHVFSSADRQWVLKLDRTHIGLATRRYIRWEDFRQRIELPVAALREFYAPVFYNHICMRYVNLIKRETLGLGRAPWSQLIAPPASGPLSDPDLGVDVQTSLNKFFFNLPARAGKVEATCGLVLEEPGKIPVFLIESHVFNDTQTDTPDGLIRLNGLHGYARDFFRWCLSRDLHDAMQPTPVD
jgi:uncharacterized protein (TIGR04255 family)